MPISVPTYTVDDLDRFPDDGNRYELLDGVLLVSPSPGMPHQVVTARLVALLSERLRPWPDLLVTSPGVIALRPRTKLEPDLLVCRAPETRLRWEAVRERFLAVEVASPSTGIYDRDFKRPAYLEIGVHEVWRVDADDRVILVSQPGEAPDRPFRDQLHWSPPGLGQTFVIDIEPLFRGLE
ncbi:MAG: Uma2 family endonuclease [Gemmatimonadales bacterium]|nr:Uma2 family endonuclease [Gemmatimonadales bacterium]